MGLFTTMTVLPELPVEKQVDSSDAFPTTSLFFHLPTTSVHTLPPLSSLTSSSSAQNHPRDSSSLLSDVHTSLKPTVWEEAATIPMQQTTWDVLAGRSMITPLWHSFPSLASRDQFEEIYRTHCIDQTTVNCVPTLTDEELVDVR